MHPVPEARRSRTQPYRVAPLLKAAERSLAASSDTPTLDAAVLLAAATDHSRAWLAAHPETVLSATARGRFQELVSRRQEGQPIAYLLGHKEFHGRRFAVTPAVLVPRPETETLVELALDALRPGDSLVDVGTGSGCIAISVKLAAPGSTVTASDVSAAALEVARRNATRLKADVAFQVADLCPILPDMSRTVVVANLPYVPSAVATDPKLAAEPKLALDGGPDGFTLINRLLEQVADRPPRRLLLEIDPSHADRLHARYADRCQIVTDLAGRDRFAVIAGSG